MRKSMAFLGLLFCFLPTIPMQKVFPFSRSQIFYDKENPFHAANMLFDESKYKEAISQYEKILGEVEGGTVQATKYQIKLAKNALGQAYRASGDLGKGYEYIADAMNSHLSKPLTKEIFKKISEKKDQSARILVHGEDGSRRFGLGDMLGDGGYLKKLSKKEVATIIARVSPQIKSIFEKNKCADEVISVDEKLPDYDYETMQFALPHFLEVEAPADIPQDPYIRSESERVGRWRSAIFDACSKGEVPIVSWHLTSDFPAPEGRKLGQRRVPLKALARELCDKQIKLLSVQCQHPPLPQAEYDQLNDKQKKECELDIVSQEQKDQITHLGDLSFEDVFALGQAVVETNGYLCGPDTALPCGLAYAIEDKERRRICMLLPFYSDARWGNSPESGSQDGRLPNVREFWQQEPDQWEVPVGAVKEYILNESC